MMENLTEKLNNLRENLTSKLVADKIYIFQYNDGTITEKRIVVLYDLRYEKEPDNRYKTKMYFEALKTGDKIIRVLHAANPEKNIFERQEGNPGYDETDYNKLNNLIEPEKRKSHYTRDELMILQDEINNVTFINEDNLKR